MTDSDTTEISLSDTDTTETPEAHLISYALTIIENAPRCLIGHEPTDEQHGERADWLKARDTWRDEFQAWLGRGRIGDRLGGDGRAARCPHAAPLTENERLIMHARVAAEQTGTPVRVVRRSLIGGSIDVQIGDVQLRAGAE